MRKTALVVDDSKTARNVLSEILETHDLDIVTVESAEDAIAYLGGSRPDIIFMDYEMSGVDDGLEALAAITDNPVAATIPIVMYKAQQGELYVGQARALGAVDVLPKQLESAEVSKLLESLRIIGKDAESLERHDRSDSAGRRGEYEDLDHADAELREMIRHLFDEQREMLRQDLEHSQENIARRLADGVRPSGAGQSENTAARRRAPAWMALGLAAAAFGVLAVVFALLFSAREDSLRDLQRQNAELQRALDERQVSATQDSVAVSEQLNDYRLSLGEITMAALDSLEWAVNQSSGYGFSDIPMGDYRLSLIQELSNHLDALDFRGVVRLESHVGNFCMTLAGPEGYGLASPDLPADQCEQLGFGPSEAYEMGLRQTAAFANFINSARASTDDSIRYEIISYGNSSPLLEYPPTPEGLTAAAWNEIAASNNRVNISLFPE